MKHFLLAALLMAVSHSADANWFTKFLCHIGLRSCGHSIVTQPSIPPTIVPAVPEPETWAMLGIGVALVFWRSKK